MNNKEAEFHPQTQAVIAGETDKQTARPVVPDLSLSTSYFTDDEVAFSIEGQGDQIPYLYTRWGNPTVRLLEQKMALLEHAEAGVATASGMAAATTLFLYCLKAGDHILISDICYAAVSEMGNQMLPELGIEVTRVNTSHAEEIEQAIQPNTRLIYTESPCNPIIRLTDLNAVVEIAHRHGAIVATDNTFGSPMATNPIDFGVDYVIHSMSKYICGHGDAIGGIVLGKARDIESIRRRVLIRTGGILSPFNAFLINRGLVTLPLRMKTHEENALQVARFLENHPAIKQVTYPGLESHPQHELAARQMKNYSGMLTFRVGKDARKLAHRMNKHLKVIKYAVSLGHHHSLIYYLPTADMLSTTFRLSSTQEADYRSYAHEGIFRMSAGLEDASDICRDLDLILNQG